MITALLIILAIVLVCGIIRVIVRPSEGILDFFIDILLLDYLGDLLSWVLGAIFNGDSDWD